MPRSIEFEDRDNSGFPAPPGAHIMRDVPVQTNFVIARDAPPPTPETPKLDDAAQATAMQNEGGKA